MRFKFKIVTASSYVDAGTILHTLFQYCMYVRGFFRKIFWKRLRQVTGPGTELMREECQSELFLIFDLNKTKMMKSVTAFFVASAILLAPAASDNS